MPIVGNNSVNLNGNVDQVVQAISAIHDVSTPNDKRTYFTQAIETLKETDPINTTALAFQLVLHSDKLVRHVGWNIIEHIIRHKWLEIDVDLRIIIRNEVLQHVSAGQYSLGPADSHIKTAISRSVVYMMENEWPQNWPELFSQFQQAVGDVKLYPQCQMVFVILRRLIEDVITLVTIEDKNRRSDLSVAIYNHLPDILKMAIARIRLCLTEGTNENAILLAKSAIELISEIVEWVNNRILEVSVDEIIDVLCEYLQTDSYGIYEIAAKCLWKLAGRKCIKTQETPIVVSMFRDTPMKSILSAASIAAQVSVSNVDHYNYLKALCDLLCALGLHLADVWSYIMRPPPNFDTYFSAISAFFTHPSLYIRAETSQVLAAFAAHERISKNPDYVRCMTSLFRHLPTCIERVVISQAAPNDLTVQYYQMDYEEDDEMLRDFLVLRDRCCKVITYSTSDHFDKLWEIVNDWFANRFMPNPDLVRSEEWDMMKKFLTTFLTAAYNYDVATPEIRKIFVSLFDAILSRIGTMSQSGSVNGALSLLSAFFQSFDDYPDRVPLVLAQLKTILMSDSDALLEVKRHCIALLLKMVTGHAEAVKVYAQDVLNAVVEVAEHVTVMQRASLVHVLGALSNLASTSEQQHDFLQNAIQNNLQYFMSQQFTRCIQSSAELFSYIGLTSPAPLTEFEATNSRYYENRVELKSHLTAIEGVLQYVEVPKDQSNPLFPLLLPVIPSFFQIVSCLNSIYRPENIALIHSSYGPKVLDITPSERQVIFFSMLESSDQKDSENELTLKPSQDQVQPLYFMRRFLHDLTEIMQKLFGFFGSKLGAELYTLPSASQLLHSLLYSVEYVPDIRLRHWIRRAWTRLICSCPHDNYEVVVPFTVGITSHFQLLIGERWNAVQNREGSEPTEEELFLESVASVLSRETAGILKSIVLGEFTPRGSKKDVTDLIDPLGRLLLNNKEVLQNTLAALAKLINCPDTQVCFKCIPVINAIVGNYFGAFDEQMATFTLVHCIRSLQVHGSDEPTLGPLLSLTFSVYSQLRPIYPSLLDVLKQVPDASEENVLNFDQRVLALVAATCNGTSAPGGKHEGKQQMPDKGKRELMRKVLKPVIAATLGEQHKRPVQLRRLV
ncbi:exportin 1-like protein [Ditylenchus destructor]|nr:exportin 1-like protein [Ditylenchus destructor]